MFCPSCGTRMQKTEHEKGSWVPDVYTCPDDATILTYIPDVKKLGHWDLSLKQATTVYKIHLMVRVSRNILHRTWESTKRDKTFTAACKRVFFADPLFDMDSCTYAGHKLFSTATDALRNLNKAKLP